MLGPKHPSFQLELDKKKRKDPITKCEGGKNDTSLVTRGINVARDIDIKYLGTHRGETVAL